MDLDKALKIVNDPSMSAYCEYVHSEVFRNYGEYEIGFDDAYDEAVMAYAFVAVELALNEEMLEFVPVEEGAIDTVAKRETAHPPPKSLGTEVDPVMQILDTWGLSRETLKDCPELVTLELRDSDESKDLIVADISARVVDDCHDSMNRTTTLSVHHADCFVVVNVQKHGNSVVNVYFTDGVSPSVLNDTLRRANEAYNFKHNRKI